MKQAARTLESILCALAILGVALAAGRAADAANSADHPNIQPGSWEVTVATEIAGMAPRPGVTVTTCIKPDQVKDSQSFAESQQKRGGKCKVSDFKLETDKLSYSFACEGGGSGSAELVFAGTTYEGTTKITAPGHGSTPMTIIQHIKARRVGDC